MIRDDRVKERAATSKEGEAIDHGGYQAAAMEFQQNIAQGRMNSSQAASSSNTIPPSLMEFNDEDLDWD